MTPALAKDVDPNGEFLRATRETQGTEADGEPRLVNGRPVGQLDYELSSAIREKIDLDGYEEARDFIAQCLNRFNDRLARRVA